MPKEKKFLIQHDYLANYGQEDRVRVTKYEVSPTAYPVVKALITSAIEKKDAEALQRLLKDDYIYGSPLRTSRVVEHDTFPSALFYHGGLGNSLIIPNPKSGQGQRDTNTYAVYKVAPVLEELLRDHQEDFLEWFHQASPECQKALMDFSHQDLTGINLPAIDYSQANFTATNLKHAIGVTQQILDESITYVNAILPEGLIPFWDDKKKETVCAEILKLRKYGLELKGSIDSEGRSKGAEAIALADRLENKIRSTPKYNSVFQSEFSTLLHEKDAMFNHKRYYGLKAIIINISFCALGLGIGYVAAGLIHKAATGRFLFFNRTETEQKIAGIGEAICPRIG